jgi:hypothetical protein
MQAFIIQVQLVLAALSAFLPLMPDSRRGEAGEILNSLGRALTLGSVVAANYDALAIKLKILRAEIEAMADAGTPATVETIEGAFARVQAASAAFRRAINLEQ